jgi:hypothetical protein
MDALKMVVRSVDNDYMRRRPVLAGVGIAGSPAAFALKVSCIW